MTQIWTYTAWHAFRCHDTDDDSDDTMAPNDFISWASALLDGGWTSADADEIRGEYFCDDSGDVDDAVAALIDTMRQIEDENSAEASQ